MIEAVTEAKNIIEANNSAVFDGLFEKVYLKQINEDEYNSDKNIVLIQDVNGNVAITGNNDFYGLDRKIEVQIYFADSFKNSYTKYEVKLMKLFQQNSWLVADNFTRSIDPDEGVQTSTFYFVKRSEIDF